jgi:hypothetical protein
VCLQAATDLDVVRELDAVIIWVRSSTAPKKDEKIRSYRASQARWKRLSNDWHPCMLSDRGLDDKPWNDVRARVAEH